MSTYNIHVAKFHIQPDKLDYAHDVLDRMFTQVPREPKTLIYIKNKPVEDSNNIYFYELYADDDGFKYHSSTETHDGVLEDLLTVISAPWEIFWLEFVYGKGA